MDYEDGWFKVEDADDKASATSQFDELESIDDPNFRNGGNATSTIQIVGEFPINDTTQLGPLLTRRIKVAKGGRFGETKAFTDLVKVNKYEGGSAAILHSDMKFTHNISKKEFGIPNSSFLVARVLEKPGGGVLKWVRSDGVEFSIGIEKGELLIMMAHAGLCNHKCESGLFTIVTDFVLPYKVIGEMNAKGGLKGKLEKMMGEFVEAKKKNTLATKAIATVSIVQAIAPTDASADNGNDRD